METQETQSLDSLNLSWPHSVHYHAGAPSPSSCNFGNDRKRKFADEGSQPPVTTYNGVPREFIRDSEPLRRGEIRLLDLKQGARGMPLEGSLRKVHLTDHPAYEPLSYTWEDYDTVQPSLDNIEDDVHPALFLLDTDRYLELTSNCAKALCSVRKSETDRTIWVDSICVNQDDAEERSHQVDLMKEIYARAFTVLIYLGRESSESDISSNMAMSLLSQPDRLRLRQLDQQEVKSLKRLFRRHYFRRMWIVQEVTLAKTLEFHCGPVTSYVSDFAGKPLEAILQVGSTPPWLRHSKQRVSNRPRHHVPRHHVPRHHERSQAAQMLNLIVDTSLCDCKDERDRIFALFSLLNPGNEERLRADYKLSTAQVFTGIAAYLATNGLLWGVLTLASHFAPSGYSGLPSWVPDWGSLRNAVSSMPHYMYRAADGLISRLDIVSGVSSSGVITIQGMLLGSVTTSKYDPEPTLRPQDDTDGSQILNHTESHSSRDFDTFGRTQGHLTLWTLAKSTQDKFLNSWGCRFSFRTSCKEPETNADHVALMLWDYRTVLILRPDERFRTLYTLFDIGMPTVNAVLPKDWKVDGDTLLEIPLRVSDSDFNYRQDHLDTILSPRETFPRLSDYPELWSHNPYTSTMTLTYTAIRRIRRIATTEVDLLEEWQNKARVGIRILRDETRLRHLIDEVNSMRHKDYRRVETAAGLDYLWSLTDFLGLFIRDPFDWKPMEWPDVHAHGDRPLDAVGTLQQLMQWAQATRRFLKLVGDERTKSTSSRWPRLDMDISLYPEALNVASFQVSIASDSVRGDASTGLELTSVLLEVILRQLLDENNPNGEQAQGPRSFNERYWDWRRFNFIMEQRYSTLSHIRPDVEKIQADLHDFRGSFKALAVRQVFAAHGSDPRKGDFVQVQIR